MLKMSLQKVVWCCNVTTTQINLPEPKLMCQTHFPQVKKKYIALNLLIGAV